MGKVDNINFWYIMYLKGLYLGPEHEEKPFLLLPDIIPHLRQLMLFYSQYSIVVQKCVP